MSEDLNTAVELPSAGLLSNGRYHVYVEADGGGHSAFDDRLITRRFGVGTGLYVAEPDAIWSAGGTADADVTSEAALGPGCYRMRRTRDGLSVTSDISVVPDRDAELRRYTLRNGSDRRRGFRFTCVTEIDVEADHAAWTSRDGTNGQSREPAGEGASSLRMEFVPDIGGVLAVRRSSTGTDLYVLHAFLGEQTQAHETDGDAFFGPDRSVRRPPGLASELTGTTERPAHPVIALQLDVALDPDEERTATLLACAGHDRSTVRSTADRMSSESVQADAFLESALREQRTRDDLKLGPRNADRYHRLAAAILKSNRAPHDAAAQNAMKRFGLDPAQPLTVCRISDESEVHLARLMLKARTFWRSIGLDVQVLILNDKSGVGANAVQHDLQEAMELATGGMAGVVLRHADVVPPEDQKALQAAARLVISGETADLLRVSG